MSCYAHSHPILHYPNRRSVFAFILHTGPRIGGIYVDLRTELTTCYHIVKRAMIGLQPQKKTGSPGSGCRFSVQYTTSRDSLFYILSVAYFYPLPE